MLREHTCACAASVGECYVEDFHRVLSFLYTYYNSIITIEVYIIFLKIFLRSFRVSPIA